VPEALPENSSLADLVKVLRSTDVGLRRRGAQGISSFSGDGKDAVPALREALKDSDAEVRMWSALALVGNGVYDKVLIPILVEALQRDSVTIRQTACIALALIPCEGPDKTLVVPALTKVATKDPSEDVRRDALTALRVIAPEMIKNE
jgi:HEAT repeat protein